MKKYLLQHKFHFFFYLMVQTLRTAGCVGVALLLNRLVDKTAESIPTGQTGSLLEYFVLCALYALILGALIFTSGCLKASLLKKILVQIRTDLMHGILQKKIPLYKEKSSASYLSLMNQNISMLEENYYNNTFSIYDDILNILIASLLLLRMNPLIAAVSVLCMAVPSLIPKLFGKRMGQYQKETAQKTADYNTLLQDILEGFEVIRNYHTEAASVTAHNQAAKNMENKKRKTANTMAAVYGLANLSSITMQFFIMTAAGFLAVKGYLTIGSIIAITQLTGQVVAPAFQLSTKFSQLKSVLPICKELEQLITIPSAESLKTEHAELYHFMELENLSFSYTANAANDTLHHINLTFEAGKKYAIIGLSGSGKSTLLKLLAGYYDTYTGKLLTDGQENTIPDSILMHQEVFLFNATVKDNITLNQSFPDAEINRAISQAGLSQLIDGLPEGIHTKVLEKGSRFSGGERQRIALARALLHRKRLLLLDEAFSALDEIKTRSIEKEILLLKDTTCICVTHKTDDETLCQYDGIIVMNNGTAVFQGTFHDYRRAANL